tara:strand:- start:412 stop:1497 length:1086 start_codon:yes stop_codon:yes gene_type:complete
MDVLVYSALNEQSSLKKQAAAKRKELFDLKANASAGGGGSGGDAEAKAWLTEHEKALQLCPDCVPLWDKMYCGEGWTGGFKVCDDTGHYTCGRSCTWTVPSGVTKARFQLWGAGGGANNPSRCCGFTFYGSTAAYASVIIPVTAGSSYTICSGCAYCCMGAPWAGAPRNPGCPSYVQGTGLCYFCAMGGDGGMGTYFGARVPSQNHCYVPCLNNATNTSMTTCEASGSICYQGGCSGGFYPYISGANYYGTTNIANPTSENIIYGIRGMWNKWCVHSNNYGCFCAGKIVGASNTQEWTTALAQTCPCHMHWSHTCCGGYYRAQNGYMRMPGQGGHMSASMGGCVSHCGDFGRLGLVCIQYQ